MAKLSKEDIEVMIREIKAEKAKAAEERKVEELPSFKELLEEKIPTPAPVPVVEVKEAVVEKPVIKEAVAGKPTALDTRGAKERIASLIERGERVSTNYYAARGANIIEVVFPYGYEDDVLAAIEYSKIDPDAPDVMVQEPSFLVVQPEFARGMAAYQLYLNDPRKLVTSGYDVVKMLTEMKDLPVIITASTTINQKPLKEAFK